jgi:hypothetical protein
VLSDYPESAWAKPGVQRIRHVFVAGGGPSAHKVKAA